MNSEIQRLTAGITPDSIRDDMTFDEIYALVVRLCRAAYGRVEISDERHWLFDEYPAPDYIEVTICDNDHKYKATKHGKTPTEALIKAAWTYLHNIYVRPELVRQAAEDVLKYSKEDIIGALVDEDNVFNVREELRRNVNRQQRNS